MSTMLCRDHGLDPCPRCDGDLPLALGSTFDEATAQPRADRHGDKVVEVRIPGHPADHVFVLSYEAARGLLADLTAIVEAF